jgi:predicted nucleic acid-binding protein
LLQKLFNEITISQEVWNEVVVRGAGLAGSSETSQAGWVKVSSVANSALVKEWRDAHNLGAGELSTILLARELTASLALIDERKARRLAGTEGLAVSGSIAVLERGYQEGIRKRSSRSIPAVTRRKHLDRSKEA